MRAFFQRSVGLATRIGFVFVVVRPLVCGADLPLVAWNGETMGSVYTVKIVGTNLAASALDRLKKDVDDRLKEVNRQMSHYLSESELSRFNRAPAGEPFPISPEFGQVVRLALELNQRSSGAFDPTLGIVINLWGFGEQGPLRQIPPADKLAQAMQQTGCRHLRLTPAGRLVKDTPGLQLNLSAIAKGFGVDEATRVLRARGFTNTYVSISGEVFVSGLNARGERWKVGVSAPLPQWRAGDPLVAVLALSGQAVSTSGDYQKYFEDAQGRRWCHIFDPRTGHPVQHRLGSVSVIADNCTVADGLSTTLFVLGAQEGLRFIEGWTNAAALFVVRDEAGAFRQEASSRFAALTGYRP
jgi:FAD:protein FMN transferase